MNEAQNLLAVLIVNLDGLIITRASVEGFKDELVGAIIAIPF
ncbi:MAG: hypothetical protein ACFFCE_16375 [Promethearchaeota archaeon]